MSVYIASIVQTLQVVCPVRYQPFPDEPATYTADCSIPRVASDFWITKDSYELFPAGIVRFYLRSLGYEGGLRRFGLFSESVRMWLSFASDMTITFSTTLGINETFIISQISGDPVPTYLIANYGRFGYLNMAASPAIYNLPLGVFTPTTLMVAPDTMRFTLPWNYGNGALLPSDPSTATVRKYYIKSINGKYLAQSGSGNWYFSATQDSNTQIECQVVKDGSTPIVSRYNFKSNSGRFLCFSDANNIQTREAAGVWEQVNVVPCNILASLCRFRLIGNTFNTVLREVGGGIFVAPLTEAEQTFDAFEFFPV